MTIQQQQQLKQMVLHQRPTDYGIERNLWTGAILATVIQQRWGVMLKDSRIYELLRHLGLSHQRGHRDYANADRQMQQQWVETVKKKFNLGSQMRKLSSLMSLLLTIVRVCFTGGRSATLAQKYLAMSGSVTNSMDCCVLMP